MLEAWAEPVDRPEGRAGVRSSHPHMAVALASSGGFSGGGAMASPPTGGTAALPPMSRPLGGFGHIIRSAVPAGPGLGTMGLPMGSLAAYRARPVALASLPMRPMHD